MSELRVLFGKKLRTLRRANDMTQENLAEKIGVSVEFISNVERGINAPSFETLEKMANVFKVKYKDLFDFTEREEV